MRAEIVLGLVAAHVPVHCRWRTLVCRELAVDAAPEPAQLQAYRTLRRVTRAWRHESTDSVARRRRRVVRSVVSWARRLHDMDAAILLSA